jgi:hypothetical protein
MISFNVNRQGKSYVLEVESQGQSRVELIQASDPAPLFDAKEILEEAFLKATDAALAQVGRADQERPRRHRNGGRRQRDPSALPKLTKKQVERLWAAHPGKTVEEIAEATGYDAKKLRKAGMPDHRPPGPPSSVVRPEYFGAVSGDEVWDVRIGRWSAPSRAYRRRTH